MRDSAASITTRMAGDIFGSVKKENYQNLGTQSLINRGEEQANAFEADAKVQAYGLQAKGTVLAAEAEAEAIKAQGAAAGQTSMMSGLASGVSSLFGGLNFGGGGTDSTFIPGVEGQDSTTHYGWNAPASQYEPGAISTPGWSWDDL